MLVQLIESELAQALERAQVQELAQEPQCWLSVLLNMVVVCLRNLHHLMKTSRKQPKKRSHPKGTKLSLLFSLGNPLKNSVV
jgi:hypothetical protein